jgi:hypothetical protein
MRKLTERKSNHNVIIVDGYNPIDDKTLWLTNSPASGYTVRLEEARKGVVRGWQRGGDEPYNEWDIEQFERSITFDNPMKTKFIKDTATEKKLYKIPVYPNLLGSEHPKGVGAAGYPNMARYDIYDIKGIDNVVTPKGYMWFVYISSPKYTLINIFDNKKEAIYWMK